MNLIPCWMKRRYFAVNCKCNNVSELQRISINYYGMNSSNFLLMNITYLVATICFVCIFYKKEICIQLYLVHVYR